MSAAAGRDLAPLFRPSSTSGGPAGEGRLPVPPESPPRSSSPESATCRRPSRHAAEHGRFRLCLNGRPRRRPESCTLMTEASTTAPLAGACPDWVLANDGESPTTRRLSGALLNRLLGAKQAISSRRDGGGARRRQRFRRQRELPIGAAWHSCPAWPAIPSGRSWTTPAALPGDPRAPGHGAAAAEGRPLVAEAFGARARQLGWRSTGADDETPVCSGRRWCRGRRQRRGPTAARRGDRAHQRWLSDRKAIEPELVDAVLATAAHAGDKQLFGQLLAEAKRAKERRDRTRLISALAGSPTRRSPSGAGHPARRVVRARESANILFTEPLAHDSPARLDFLKRNFDVLARRWPPESLAYSPSSPPPSATRSTVPTSRLLQGPSPTSRAGRDLWPRPTRPPVSASYKNPRRRARAVSGQY